MNVGMKSVVKTILGILVFFSYQLIATLLFFFFSLSHQVQMDVDVRIVQDQLKGDSITEIRLKFIKRLEDALPAGED